MFLEQARIAAMRRKLGRHSKSLIITGLRGTGKTVLLRRVEQIAEEVGFTTAFIEAQDEKKLPQLLVPQLRRVLLKLDRMGALSSRVKRGLRALKGFVNAVKVKYGDIDISLDLDPEAGLADSGDLETDLPDLFAAVGMAAQDRKAGFALILDEVQYLDEASLGALIMALHRTDQEGLPVLLAAAGLPQVTGLAGRAKSYAERLFDFPVIGPLERVDADKALQEPARSGGARFSSPALNAIHQQTRGYPYFVQEWGFECWNLAAGPQIRANDVARATKRAIAKLDEGFFRVRFDRLTPGEKGYMRAMAGLGAGPHRSGDIARQLDREVTSLGPLRAKLIAKGVIYTPGHGDTAFTVPLFHEFLIRVMPDWSPQPPVRRGNDRGAKRA